jgi:outer membrane protein OmpA-like peptidoglycan-associated protein
MGAVIIIAIAVVAIMMQPAPADRVVLLPGADGKTGAVSVKTAGGERLLDQAYAAAAVDRQGRIEAVREDEASVRARYGAALGAQPMRPASFVVNFVSGTDELTAESRPVLDQVKTESARRPAAEIVAIGHTDRVGTDAANDALSLKRAEAVRAALLAAGVAARIEAAGRGEREPLIATADEVAEPRNRRVEINVR